MSFASRTTSLQSYHMLLYRKPQHPELFGIEATRQVRHGEYEFDSWIFRGGHVLHFNFEGMCVSEIVTERMSGLPERAQIAILPCAGEKDFEEKICDRIEFIASVQTETLADHLYLATFREMVQHAQEGQCLSTTWTGPDEDLPSLSVLDLQRYHNEVHVQSYHLRGDCSLVLRTQTIFRALEQSKRPAATA